ncbi:MAG: hypothetical protein WDW36_008993 [Sanguina aurantia]
MGLGVLPGARELGTTRKPPSLLSCWAVVSPVQAAEPRCAAQLCATPAVVPNPYTYEAYPLLLLKNEWQPASSNLLLGEFPAARTAQGPLMEFWLEAGGFIQRCYALATPMLPTHIAPVRQGLYYVSRPPASQFKVRWPLVTFYNMTSDEFALLVQMHIRWHVRMGVHQHIIYITEAVLAAASHPVIKAYIADGSVEIIMWDVMALNYDPSQTDSASQGDAHILSQQQNLMYAHAVLTYWMTPTYLVLGDLDEYFMTSRPMTIAEVMFSDEYAAHQVMSILNVQIVDAFCAKCEADGVRELDTWTDPAYTKGQHPIAMYELQREGREFGGWYPDKDICDVNYVSQIHIHESRELEGRRWHITETNDVIFLHMRNLYTKRGRGGAGEIEGPRPEDVAFWWPLHLNDTAKQP